MSVFILFSAIAAWLIWAAMAGLIQRVSTRPDDPRTGMAKLVLAIYVRLFHRLRVEGRAFIPQTSRRRDGRDAGPTTDDGRAIIIVANHTAGVDPLLIQSAFPYEIRWIMSSDMRWPIFDPIWSWSRVIFVEQGPESGAGIRKALDALRAGEVVGVFPEGRIERPAGAILPFKAGIGVLVRRSGAEVLPVLIRGTPESPTARKSLFRRSRAIIEFCEPIDYPRSGVSAQGIADDLERRYTEWTIPKPNQDRRSPGMSSPVIAAP